MDPLPFLAGHRWTPCQLFPETFEAAGAAEPLPADVLAAQRLCRDCTVRAGCAQWAVDNGEEWGIWGGLTARQRSVKRRVSRERVSVA